VGNRRPHTEDEDEVTKYDFRNFRHALQPKIFCAFADQVKLLLILSYGGFEAIRHKTHCKRPFKKP
jgi:hypothetical protein